MMDKNIFINLMENYCKSNFNKTIENASCKEILKVLSLVIMQNIYENWENTNKVYKENKKIHYFSAEYLMGKALGNNLVNLGIYEEIGEILKTKGINLCDLEEVESDAGLGNGGLGRLAACFLDSAATMNYPMYGYGIRYENGLFSQKIVDGRQVEYTDEWTKSGEIFYTRKEEEALEVEFNDFKVKAVPYDTPIIAYGSKNINTLRLWKAESYLDFDFKMFNDQMYKESMEEKINIENISRVLYPNDSTDKGKILRLRQQYFMVSCSLKDIINKYIGVFGKDFSKFHELNVIQLNDTHPVLAIPEFIRIMIDDYKCDFEYALNISEKIFAYTNHTILKEALEVWNLDLVKMVSEKIVNIIERMDSYYKNKISNIVNEEEKSEFFIIQNNFVHMANLAIHVCFSVNGVAEIHTNILKNIELKNWYKLYPNKFNNKTNGITPRRWLKLSNPELSHFITKLLKTEQWVKNLDLLKEIDKFSESKEVLDEFINIKQEKKNQLTKYIENIQGIKINSESLFDIQIKRIHEYKRQLLNAFYILDLYYTLKENDDLDIPNITFIFGGKAFPGYLKAKTIIKFIGEVAKLINNDEKLNKKLKVVFCENYGVSYAEKLIPSADVSEQISTAGKEASGTGNMKFMLNGAVTFGTYDGANVEIVRESGFENNFIFGLRVEDIENLKDKYNPKEYYENNKDIKKVLDSLIDGTLSDDNTGEFKELYNSILEYDQYFLLGDFKYFKEEKKKLFEAYKNKYLWAKMCLKNVSNAGVFSSDRTIKQYAEEIWNIKKLQVK